jgi:imidazolonepropionase
MMDVFVKNASEVCLPEASGRGVQRLAAYAVLIRDGRVVWLGPESHAPADADGVPVHDAKGGAVLPALVDCHTHLVFAGDRIEDFADRARGATYGEIAARGGGILTTVRATRAASKMELKGLLTERVLFRSRYGIGTTEVKSGYGLSVEHELGMLRAVRDLVSPAPHLFDLEATLLAAHAVPEDVSRDVYVASIIEEMIPTVAREGLARFVDVFVEQGAYTVDEARRVFAAALGHGLIPRVHADQISAGGGAELAAEVGAASADHLERTGPDGMRALAAAKVVGVLLPAAMIFLGDQARKQGRALVDAGVEVAVATDANPGSSPMMNLPLAATLATTQMGLTVEESLRAITLGAAHALRRKDIGTLAPGARGRFIVLNHRDSRALVAAFGEPIVRELKLVG